MVPQRDTARKPFVMDNHHALLDIHAGTVRRNHDEKGTYSNQAPINCQFTLFEGLNCQQLTAKENQQTDGKILARSTSSSINLRKLGQICWRSNFSVFKEWRSQSKEVEPSGPRRNPIHRSSRISSPWTGLHGMKVHKLQASNTKIHSTP